MSRDRGRLTIPDVVVALVVFFFLGALWPVFYDGYQRIAPDVSPGVELLAQFALPLAILVLLAVIVRRTTAGVGR